MSQNIIDFTLDDAQLVELTFLIALENQRSRVNLAMGLTAMRVGTFAAVSQIGMLPGTIVYVNAGTQLAAIESAGWGCQAAPAAPLKAV